MRRRITQIRRSLSDIFNLRNDMVRAVDNRDEEALTRAMQEMSGRLWDLRHHLAMGEAEDQEAMELIAEEKRRKIRLEGLRGRKP